MAAAAAGAAAFVARSVVVHVAVGDFFGGGGTDFADGDVEGEGFAGQRVVGVDRDGVAFDGDHDNVVGAVFAGGAEAHAGFDIGALRENRAVDLPHAAFVAQSVGFDGRNGDVEFLAGGFAFEGFFESGHNAGVAVHVGHGGAVGGGVEHFGAAVADFVVEENGVVFGDFHEWLL